MLKGVPTDLGGKLTEWNNMENKRMNWGPMSNVPENEAKSEHWVSVTSVLTTLNHWYSVVQVL